MRVAHRLWILPALSLLAGCGRARSSAADAPPKEVSVPCVGGGGSTKILCSAANAALCEEAKKGVLCRDKYLDELDSSVHINNWTDGKKWGDVRGKVTWYDFESPRFSEHDGKKCIEVSRGATVMVCAKSVAPKSRGYAKFESYQKGLFSDDVTLLEERSFDGTEAQAELLLRDVAKAGFTRELLVKRLEETDVPLELFGAEVLPFGVDPLEIRKDIQGRKAEIAAKAKAKEEARAARRAANSRVSYPARCADVSAATHVPVAGATDLCVPKAEGVLLLALAQEKKVVASLPEIPEAYSDNSPFSAFIAPSAIAEDKSTLNATERQAIAKEFATKTYLVTTGQEAKWTWVAPASKLSLELQLSKRKIAFGEPSVTRKQDCSGGINTTCGGGCSTNSDCQGWTCGCAGSVCAFGRCTACPSLRACGSPDFDLTVPAFSAAQVLSGEAREVGPTASSLQIVLPVRVEGAWRRVFAKPDEPKALEHDTGIFARVSALGLFGLSCGEDPCGRNSPQVLAMNAKPFTVVVESTSGKAKVDCTAGICSASVGK